MKIKITMRDKKEFILNNVDVSFREYANTLLAMESKWLIFNDMALASDKIMAIEEMKENL